MKSLRCPKEAPGSRRRCRSTHIVDKGPTRDGRHHIVSCMSCGYTWRTRNAHRIEGVRDAWAEGFRAGLVAVAYIINSTVDIELADYRTLLDRIRALEPKNEGGAKP